MFDPQVLKTVLIVALFFAIFVVLPIVAIMTEHQRKMAALIRGAKPEEGSTSETTQIIAALNGQSVGGTNSAELAELKLRVGALERELDGLRSRLALPPTSDAVSDFAEPGAR